MSPALKMQIIAETAKLAYYLSSLNTEVNKEEEDPTTIKVKFNLMNDQIIYVLKPLMDQIVL